MRKIKITLHGDGTQSIEVLGAQGDECVELTRTLEGRLGAIVGERSLKTEYTETKQVEGDLEEEPGS